MQRHPPHPFETAPDVNRGILDKLSSIESLLKNPPNKTNRIQAGPLYAITRSYPTSNIRFYQRLATGTADELLKADDSRLALLIYNLGAVTVNVGTDAVAIQGAGTESFPLGGAVALSLDNYTGPIWVISTGANVTLGLIVMRQ